MWSGHQTLPMKSKNDIGRTFNFDKPDVIDLTKFSHLIFERGTFL